MQSIRQYRQLRKGVERQLDPKSRSDEKAVGLTPHGSGRTSEDGDMDAKAKINPGITTSATGGTPGARQVVNQPREGILVRDREDHEGGEGLVFVVGFDGLDDPQEPHNWGLPRRVAATMVVSLIAFSVTAGSSIDAAVTTQSSAAYGVSEVPGSLTTGIYLMGFATGSLFAGSFSETFGRNMVYAGSMFFYMIWLIGAGLAPNFAAKLVFRALAGFFGSTPLTVAGGTVADVWSPLEATFGFPLFAISGFGGPVLGPVIGAFMAQGTISWRWTEWIMAILAGLVLIIIFFCQPETYAPLLLTWKAQHLRQITGDRRYRSEMEIIKMSLWHRLGSNMIRPFMLVYTEPIILVIALYLTIIYAVLFSFFGGFTFIFSNIHGTSQGVTNLMWLGVLVGVFMAFPLVPLVYSWTKKEFELAAAKGKGVRPEIRLWFVMLGGSFAVPVSLFWIGWTSYAGISIWSPIIATVLFGYGVITIFTSAYMYIIEVYYTYAASALTFGAFSRYMVAGGMTVAAIPMYENLGVHWTMTLLGCISGVMAPVPFILYYYGHRVRSWSKNVLNRN